MPEIIYNVKIRIPREAKDDDGNIDVLYNAEALLESVIDHLARSGYTRPPRRKFSKSSLTVTYSGVSLSDDPRKGVTNLVNVIYAITDDATVTISPYAKPRRRLSKREIRLQNEREIDDLLAESAKKRGQKPAQRITRKDLKRQGLI